MTVVNGSKVESGESAVARALEHLSREELIELVEAQGESGIKITFAGKANARRLARKVRPRVTRTIKKYSAGSPEDQARNLVVEGDNLQALATLYRERAQVDLIIADPPYNTGKDFRYNDKWDDDPNDPGLGDFVGVDDRARHTKWMKFMWPRLQMMKGMLKPGGVLAICIDQRELFRLGQMLDELFREENRIAIINWQRSYTRTNDATHVATNTEYVLVYARDVDKARTGLLPRTSDSEQDGVMPDGDPMSWVDAPATGSNAKAHKSMVYAIQSPFTGELLYPPMGSAWRAGQDQNLEWLRGWGCEYELRDLDDADMRASIIGVPKDEAPNVKAIVLAESVESAAAKAREIQEKGPLPMMFFLKNGLGRPRLKKYTDTLKPGFVPTTFWADEDLEFPEELGTVSWPHEVSGHSEQGVDELTAIVGPGHEFKTVKPMKLFQRIIQLWCPSEGLVLDPFAGSGTTGHAVLALNATDSASRRFILIEQGRPEKGDSYARSLLADRMTRVVSGTWHNGKGKALAGGYRFVTLDKKVDADTLLRMERDEMVDTVIASHFEASGRRGGNLVGVGGDYKYLVARSIDDEGFFLVWDGPEKNTDFTEDVYGACAEEAKAAGLRPVYHVYARLYLYQTDNVRFYQIPDRILADFGLDLRSEPFEDVPE